jgi:inosose dehydratase
MYKVKLGINPIGWTNDDMPELGKENTFEQCISEIALSGFEGTEVGNKFPKNVNVLRDALSLRGLEIASGWFSSFLTTTSLEENVEKFLKHRDFLYEMGAKVIVVSEQGYSIQGKMDIPLFENKPIFRDEDWEKLVSGLHVYGDLAKEKEMQIVYHHHMGTGIQTEEEIDKLMSLTDPSRVYLLFDTGHLFLSNIEPMTILEKYQDRIKHVHLKDVRIDIVEEAKREKLSFLQAVRNGIFTVPGDGDIDFIPIFDFLKRNNYEGWILVEAEQDPSKANPFKYAKMARNYIKAKAGI